MKQLLLVAGGISLSTILFVILCPIILLILLLKFGFEKLDNHV